jgi:hypothetical protein
MTNVKPKVSVSQDIQHMHAHYDIPTAVGNLSSEQLKEFLEFRFRFLQEEIDEGKDAIHNKDAEEIVDSLIDLVVVAVGTLDLFNVNFDQAWNEVLKANMNKRVGIKASRPNKFQLPDLVKDSSWVAPNHQGNHGKLADIFN